VARWADARHALRPLGLSPILCEAERRGERGITVEFLMESHACRPFRAYARGLLLGDLSVATIEEGSNRLAQSKALMALEYVLQHSNHGQVKKVLEALEEFAVKVLKPSRQWFKIAAGAKGLVVERALRRAPEGACLEIGTYVGFTAIRCAAGRAPNGRVVSLEVDPEHAVVAQCMALHAGVGRQVEVWTGHSGDVIRSLPERYPGWTPRFAMVFMDQCGSRFWADLELLIREDMLLPGAVILADNVLKPGAPLFLWQLFHGRGRELFSQRQLISLEEFAMPGVEDCMAMAIYNPDGMAMAGADKAPPAEVSALEFEADQVRAKAATSGSVPFEDWSVFAARMKKSLQDLKIEITEWIVPEVDSKEPK
ncbi:unnamed protein product, partial [Durusdinium trenchii]